MCECEWFQDSLQYVGFRMWNGVLPGQAQSIHLHFSKGSRFMDQALKFSVLKFLCRGLSSGSSLSPRQIPTVGYSNNCRLLDSFQCSQGWLLLSLWGSSSSFSYTQRSLVLLWHSSASRIFSLHAWGLGIWSFSWFLHCYSKITGINTSISNAFSFFWTVVCYLVTMLCFQCSHPMES